MMTTGTALTIAWTGAALLMAALWLVQRRTGNAGIVDVAWSFATGLLGLFFAAVAAGAMSRRLIVAAMAGLWGVRLGLHLLRRVSSEAEDGRYRHLRGEWGPAAPWKLFGFFQLQAIWAVMFAAPMLAAASNAARPWSWIDLAGVGLFVVSITGESIADRQLARFRADPALRGQVCRDGLWRYSRHPNYFFEWLHWWAYLFLAAGSSLWWVPCLGVLTMLLFLTKITGIPPTEAQALRSRGDAYRRYQRSTSAFFPWPPSDGDHE